MIHSDWQEALWRSVPSALLVLLTLLVSRLPVPFYDGTLPMLPALSVIYYWSLFRPSALPVWVVVLVAFVHDVLYGLPIGVSLFVFIALRLITGWMRQRMNLRQFAFAWASYALVILAAYGSVCMWQHWVHHVGLVHLFGAYAHLFLFTWLSYPLLHVFFNWCYRQMPPISVREII